MNNECNQNKHFFSRGFNANITIHYSKKTFCNASCLLLYETTFLIIAGVPGEKPFKERESGILSEVT